ncbi:aliphatic sulfonate ABC transporter substrate-binding protein [Burkholderia pseudomultivorans]|uniref:aliphatic sulfonate ABC transporter substrate-binding protein n=1 Tax=Burkholderia pseudomultivorans TaxID=1207504 RepID=UPI0028752AAF|nr:aliphatic sulfonate ABC transporter substrate-binding protein [Burkholderia pseudomultivorans]MDS0795218.1 aliphatic sulfonate ABC transporter substrate-binding protein [Burkholderia pseudomultivorans]
MTSMNRRTFARAMLAAGLTAAGVRARADDAPATLRIGYQKSSTLITLLKTRGTLEQALAPLGMRVSWHEFASGLPLTEALNVGAVDFSADVADTVPVFAQAAHARFVYVAQEAPSPKAQAIVVKQDGALRTLADLKGKRIAVTKAAGSHYLLLAALARAKLAPADAAVHYLTPADGRAAFERGSVDAWITWDPYVASVDRNPDVRILADGDGLASYQRYYLASSSFAAARPDVVQILFDRLSQAGAWLRAHQPEAANTLAPIWGLDAVTIERANARRSYVVREVLRQNFGEQQKIADTFLAAGLLPARVDTAQALRWNFAAKRADPVGA